MPVCNYKLFIREAETPEKIFYLVVKVSRVAPYSEFLPPIICLVRRVDDMEDHYMKLLLLSFFETALRR